MDLIFSETTFFQKFISPNFARMDFLSFGLSYLCLFFETVAEFGVCTFNVRIVVRTTPLQRRVIVREKAKQLNLPNPHNHRTAI